MKAYVCSIVAALLCAGCNAAAVAPQPSGSPSPPITLGRGSLAVINRANPNARRVWVFPPDSDQFKQELLVNGSEYRPNSLAFDRRGHLYIGINNAASGGSYHIVDVEVQKLDIVREIRVPQWENSSVAVDDRDNLYVNTKAFVGGDIKIYRDNKETSPYIEIKDHHSPLTMLVTHDALWVGYEGAFSDALARYRLRPRTGRGFRRSEPTSRLAVAANADGSLLAAFIRTKSTRAVEVYEVPDGQARAYAAEQQEPRGNDERRSRTHLRFRKRTTGRRAGENTSVYVPRLYPLIRTQRDASCGARGESGRWNALSCK